MSTTVLRRVALPSNLRVYELEKFYRRSPVTQPGQLVDLSHKQKSLTEALASCAVKADFLQVDTLKGVVVNTKLTSKHVDPHFASYLQDLLAAHGAK
ncbi:unnamed protein product [Vitrella brassicaformis CCMP3155]|uniref:Uncharacterized protein n=1 Tax=Vitrella brassicaformis (strain CCMP3155) TaxID=1169540 RepID=A0A0G4G9H0_VITBC|nr:unnamed protein product [Vitrella brassicaformis CCMP3155]|eukprot:CEM25514.1 unnamed protein product [Vitrella brassicaformis CCMP3155]